MFLGLLNVGLAVLLAGKPPCTCLRTLYKCLMASKSNLNPVAVRSGPNSTSIEKPDTSLPAPTPTIPRVTVTKPAVVTGIIAGIPAMPTLATSSSPLGKVLASPVKVMSPIDPVIPSPDGAVLALAAKVMLPKPRVASLLVHTALEVARVVILPRLEVISMLSEGYIISVG